MSIGGAFLIVIIVVVLIALGAALYFTGGFLWLRKTDPRGDRLGGSEERGERPRHRRVEDPSATRSDDFADAREERERDDAGEDEDRGEAQPARHNR